MAQQAASPDLDLITIVVQFKDEDKVLDAIAKAGAPGATYFYGRGTGIRQRLGLLGHLIAVEKVVIMTAVPGPKVDAVVDAATAAAALDKPGNGFLFVHKIGRTVGLY